MQIQRYIDATGAIHYAQRHGEGEGRWERLDGSGWGDWHPSGQEAQMVTLLAPLEPTLILGIGLNYRRHAEETGAALPEWPVLFMKSPAALQHPGGPIALPTTLASHEVDAEGELAVVIGRPCRNVSRSDALDYVLGYTCANDVSARDWQKHWGGGQWCRGKTFDTFAPLGPWITTADALPDPQALRLRTSINGVTVQDSSTADMIFSVAALIEFLSASTTLPAGTVILTGTPEGVGMAANPPRWLQRGDTVSINIEGIGTLTNPVVLESEIPPPMAP
jgi:2-keto-4-pentenoate hydratase/2-oxohepta-3-ene-1,7-dioic acid hydratase in catechol pathway